MGEDGKRRKRCVSQRIPSVDGAIQWRSSAADAFPIGKPEQATLRIAPNSFAPVFAPNSLSPECQSTLDIATEHEFAERVQAQYDSAVQPTRCGRGQARDGEPTKHRESTNDLAGFGLGRSPQRCPTPVHAACG